MRPEDFDTIYRLHYRAVYASALTVLRDPGRAEDVAQEVFLRFWREPGRFDPSRGPLAPYLRLLARSRALDLWRSERSGERARERATLLRERDEAPDHERPDLAAEHEAERRTLVGALRRLPAPQSEAIFLRYFGGLGVSEIAQRSGVPAGTAKGRIRIGLDKLRAETATA
jgi:RNA polymerase sigma-70 factor (ECF subfamily)